MIENKKVFLNEFLCRVANCNNKARAKFKGIGYCQKHYVRMRKRGTLKLPDETIWLDNLKKARIKYLSEVGKLDRELFLNSKAGKAWRTVWQIKQDAIKMKYSWNLSDIQVYNLFIADCIYCGAKSNWPKNRNGIDRVDSKKGYYPANCVTSCLTCNMAKGTKSLKEFMDWIRRLCLMQFKDKLLDNDC